MNIISLHSGHQDVSTIQETIFRETRKRHKYNLYSYMPKSLHILIMAEFLVKIHGSILK